MNKYNNLLTRISNDYAIKRGKTEEQSLWKARIIYSFLGRMGIASLFDGLEEGEVSIVHFKKRIINILNSYLSMYKEIRGLFPESSESVAQEIYDIFLHTGILYHKPDRIMMSCQSNSVCGGVKFIRGYTLDSSQMLSGLGSYIMQKEDEKTIPPTEMFMLDNIPLVEKWKFYSKGSRWIQFEPDHMTKYLRLEPPFTKGYWNDSPDKINETSILRTGFPGSQLYYLYKIEEGKTIVSQLPQWQVEEMNYRSLSNACLAYRGTLPPITYRMDGDIVYVGFQYLPPPAELYFWKLYSWPTQFKDLPCDFNRVCSSNTFDAIKAVMEIQGYMFEKE